MQNKMKRNSPHIVKRLGIITKTTIIILVIGLVINHISFTALAKLLDKPSNNIYYDSITNVTNISKYEIVDEKTKNSKTYKSENGLSETEIYNKAVHYLDNGKYVNIDNTLIDFGDYYRNNKNSFFINFPKTLKDKAIELDYQDYLMKIYFDDFAADAIINNDIDRKIENLHDSIFYQVDENVTLKYDILNESIKENIILNNYSSDFSYSYFIETHLSLESKDDKLYFYNNDELIFLFDSYLMYDKDYNISFDIQTNIEKISDTIYKIEVIPSNDYLANANYPVIIDPEIQIIDGGILDGVVTLSEDDYLNNTSTYKSIGSFTVNNRNNNLLNDDIVANFYVRIPRIYNTNISELITKNQLMYANMTLTTISTNANSTTKAHLKYSGDIIDSVVFHNSNVFNHKFNIIDAIGEEIDTFINNDLYFILELSLDGANNTYVNYSLGWDLGGDKPVITLGYLSDAGLSNYFTYEEFPMNNESDIYVAHNSGNLTYIYEDYQSDILLNLSHVYNTNRNNSITTDDDSIYGSGFDLNYHEYIEDINNSLKLYKGNGKIIEFVSTLNNQYLSTDGTGDVITKIYENNVLTGYEMKVGSSIYLYDASGNLITIYLNEADRENGIWDSDAKKIVITYTNGVITEIIDNYGNYITLSYGTSVNDNPTINQIGVGYLSNIEVYRYNPNTLNSSLVLNIDYEYTSGLLTNISKEYINVSDNSSLIHVTTINYNTRNQINKLTRNNKGYTFTYDNRNRVKQVKIYNNNLTNGDYLNFEYIPNGKETSIINSKGEVTKYSFDQSYHTIKQENPNNYTTFYRYYDIYQDVNINYNLNHKIINQSNSFKNISNMVTNHGFEIITSSNSIYGWTKDVSASSSATILTNNYLYGSHVLELSKGSGNAKVYQNISVEQGKEYIISCYIKNNNGGYGAYLDVVGLDGTVTPTFRTNNIKNTTDFSYYEYRFTSTFTGNARIYLVNESSGNAYFDNINVKENFIDTRYNYLENSSFEKGTTGWNGNNYYIDDNLYFDANSGVKSILLDNGYISQTINKVGTQGDTYVFGGYAKFENYTADVTVSLTFNNLNGDSDTYIYEYKTATEASEYYMIKAVALSDYNSITLRIDNESISSYVWIDNYSLYNESYGISISYNSNGYITSSHNEIDDTNTSYAYDTNNKITSITTDNDEVSYSYDTRGNLNQIENKNVTASLEIDNNDNVTEITTTDTNLNGINYYFGSTIYSSDGLYPISSEDVLGNITTTTYDYLTGLVTNIIDSDSRFNSFMYDELGNVKTYTEGKGNNTKTVTYTYDTESNLTSITIGNTIYTFTYNCYNDLTSISINNEQIVSYNYDMNQEVYRKELLSETYSYGTIYFEYYDNGLVKSISYGNTKLKEIIYNDYDEIASIIDCLEDVTYYYNYDYQNRLINVNRSDGNNITYSYDSSSRLVNKENINGIASYTYSDISNSNDFENKVLTEENISSIYKIHYGYSNDDYANLDVISFYINNNLLFEKEYDREIVTKDNIDYYTGRISKLEYTIGNDIIRYEYTYDNYSNIIEINGYTNNVLTYFERNLYDIFNQLIGQELTINGTRYLSEYGYDARGNVDGFYIMNRDTYDIIHTASFTYNAKNQLTSSYIDGVNNVYSYQNSLISSYNGFNINYYFNKLGSLVNNQTEILYYYNSDGLRTAKEVDGIITYFVLEGNKIIKETKNNNEINYYYDSQDEIIGFTYNNQKYLYLKNLQKDIIGIVDANGNIVVKYYYEAYGNLISIIDTSGINLGNINPFRYRSYYYDTETGWYYLNSRFYDPLIKRFITPDDISYLGENGNIISYNLYCYCYNNPVVLADYNGFDARLILEFDLKGGLPILGHMALLVQDEYKDWHLIEFTGNKKKDAAVKIVKGKDRFEKPQKIWKRLLACFCISGWMSIDIEGDFINSLKYARNNKYKYNGKYNLLTNNCVHFVRDALRCGDANNDLLDLYFICSTTPSPVVFYTHVYEVSKLKNFYRYSPLIYGGRYS